MAEAVEFYLTREAAEEALERVLRDQPDWQDLLAIQECPPNFWPDYLLSSPRQSDTAAPVFVRMHSEQSKLSWSAGWATPTYDEWDTARAMSQEGDDTSHRGGES